MYADKLGITLDYMLGDTADEAAFYNLCQTKDKPFYRIFIDVTVKMGLDIPDIFRVTGLTDKQVRTIITRRIKDAPLALQLSDTVGVPLAVWVGDMIYTPSDISVEGREVGMAYDRTDTKERNIVRTVLDSEPIDSKGELNMNAVVYACYSSHKPPGSTTTRVSEGF